MRGWISTLVVIAIPGVAWTRVDFPLWGMLLWVGAAAVVPGFWRRARWYGVLLGVVGWITIGLGGLELLAWLDSPRRAVVSEPDIYAVDSLLGKRLVPSAEGRHRKRFGGRSVFDVRYTVGPDGLRVTGPEQVEAAAAPEHAVLCFGGSFMFGLGLSDEQSVPWRLQATLGDRYCVYNWAQQAWGPHQALARVEFGEVEQVVNEPPDVAVYWAIPDHVRRVTGRRSWDRSGPRYRMEDDGRALFGGALSEGPLPASSQTLWTRLTAKSCALDRLRLRLGRETDSAGDIKLWAAIVERLGDEIGARFEGCRFVVFLLTSNAVGAAMESALNERGIVTIPMTRFLPDDPTRPGEWSLDPRDGHPSVEAAGRVAEGLAAWVRAR